MKLDTARQYKFTLRSEYLGDLFAALANDAPYKIQYAASNDGVKALAYNVAAGTNVGEDLVISLLLDTSDAQRSGKDLSHIASTLTFVFNVKYESYEVLTVADLPAGDLHKFVRAIKANTCINTLYHDSLGRIIIDSDNSHVAIRAAESYILLTSGVIVSNLINASVTL